MLLSALLTSAVVATADENILSLEIQEFSKETTEWVLAGKSLPGDYRTRLMKMEPADRLQAIILLRRAGLLDAEAWPLAEILGEPETEEPPAP